MTKSNLHRPRTTAPRRMAIRLFPALLAMVLLWPGHVAAGDNWSPQNLDWSRADLSAVDGLADGEIRAISGDRADNLVMATSKNHLFQLEAAGDVWSRMESFTDWLKQEVDFNPIAGRSLSAAGRFIIVGGRGKDGASQSRLAVFDGESWTTVETGVPSHNNQSVSYVVSSESGGASVGDVVTVVARDSGRLLRLLDGKAEEGFDKSARVPDSRASSYRGVAALPAANRVYATGNLSEADGGFVSVIASDQAGAAGTWNYLAELDTSLGSSCLHPVDENTLVLGTTSHGGTHGRVYLSLDGGSSWKRISPFNESWMNWVEAVWADKPDNIYAAIRGLGVQHYDGNAWSPVEAIPADARIITIHHSGDRIWFGGCNAEEKPLLFSARPR